MRSACIIVTSQQHLVLTHRNEMENRPLVALYQKDRYEPCYIFYLWCYTVYNCSILQSKRKLYVINRFCKVRGYSRQGCFCLYIQCFIIFLLLLPFFLLVLSVICMLAYRRLCLIIYCATCCPINLAGMWANSLKADDYQGTKNISFVWYLEPYYFFIPTKKWETMGVFDLRNGMSIFFSLIFFLVCGMEWVDPSLHCSQANN